MADITIAPASVLQSTGATINSGIAAAAITQGQAVYILSTGTIGLADSNGVSPANSFAGIAVTTCAAAGQKIYYASSDPNFVIGGTLTLKSGLFLSNTPGGITETYADLASGSVVIIIGAQLSTTNAIIQPITGGVK